MNLCLVPIQIILRGCRSAEEEESVVASTVSAHPTLSAGIDCLAFSPFFVNLNCHVLISRILLRLLNVLADTPAWGSRLTPTNCFLLPGFGETWSVKKMCSLVASERAGMHA